MSEPENRIATIRPVEEDEAIWQGRRDLCRHQADQEHRLRAPLLAGDRHQSGAARAGLDEPENADASRVGRPGRRLDPTTREIIALAVSATNGCPYCINSHTAALRKLGVDQETLGEVMAIVGLFNMTNSLANGYQVEPDVRPRLEP